MTKSMTGFGRADAAVDGTNVLVEISSVNRKQGDISVSLPRVLAEFEPLVRDAVAARVARGRVSVKVTLDAFDGSLGGETLVVDRALAQRYAEELAGMGDLCRVPVSVQASDLLRAPGVFRLEDAAVAPDAVRPAIEAALAGALSQLDSMRLAEGDGLQRDITARLETVRGLAAQIRGLAPAVADHYRKGLRRRLSESGLELDLDDERVLREVGIFAERCDITEELTRLESHLAQFANIMAGDEPAGRPLDFLSQELNREANTIGSKANSAEIAHLVVATKAEIEKIREQVQNLE